MILLTSEVSGDSSTGAAARPEAPARSTGARVNTVIVSAQEDARFKAALMGIIDKSLCGFVTKGRTGEAMWGALMEVFDAQKSIRVNNLMQRLGNLRLESGEKVTGYVSRVLEIYNDLKDADSAPGSQFMVHQVMKGLPEAYNPVKASLVVLGGGGRSILEVLPMLASFEEQWWGRWRSRWLSLGGRRGANCATTVRSLAT